MWSREQNNICVGHLFNWSWRSVGDSNLYLWYFSLTEDLREWKTKNDFKMTFKHYVINYGDRWSSTYTEPNGTLPGYTTPSSVRLDFDNKEDE